MEHKAPTTARGKIMLTDSIFEQGVSHKVCEDYALHGDGYAILADGCSSGQHTDWGARLLVKAAEQHLARQKQHAMQFYNAVGGTALAQARSLTGLPESCLTATLLTVQQIEDAFKAFVMGDGIVGGRRRDGRWKIHTIDFVGPHRKGAPYYLKYDIFGEIDLWLENCGGDYKATTYFGNIMAPGIEYPSELPTSYEQRCQGWAQLVSTTVSDKQFDKDHPYEEFDFPVEEYDLVFICSDGPEQFYEKRRTKTEKRNEDLHMLDILRVLLDFQSYPVGFLQLQRDWAFKQERQGTFKARNWENDDDVSVGAIYCA
jgi:hypothetical protein